MRGLKKGVTFLGRFFLSAIFIISAIQKIFTWNGTSESVFNQMCEWSLSSQVSNGLQLFFERLLGWIPLLLAVHVIFELVGGVLLILGIRVRLAAFLLIISLIPGTLLYHNFWMLEGEAASLQTIMFLKNLSILGGLLIVLGVGNEERSEG